MNVEEIKRKLSSKADSNPIVWYYVSGLDNVTNLEIDGVYGLWDGALIYDSGYQVEGRQEASAVLRALMKYFKALHGN